MFDPSELHRRFADGKAAIVAGLRGIADDLERLDVPDPVEVMI